MMEQFVKGNQEGWCHDHSDWSGFYHTYPYFKPDSFDNFFSEPRKVHVFVPRDYELSETAYPVIYMNDGNTVFFEGGAYHKTWKMSTLLTRLYVSSRMRKVIVVAVSPIDRDYEYTHAPMRVREWGGLEDYSRYLATSVKGFIDDNYRTIKEANQTLLLGASHGGLAAFYTALQHPEQFGLVAALSPSFWVGLDRVYDQENFDIFDDYFGTLDGSTLIASSRKTLNDEQLKPKIYLDWGLIREGGHHNAVIEERATARGREMKALLMEKFGYQEDHNLWTVEDTEGEHNEESWSRRLEYVLPLFYPS
ncbi:MAG: alpha/beta hydrolase [Microcystaceae cyanobacterium]